MKKYQRILAFLGILILVGLNGLTLFFALIDHPLKSSFLTASLYCTFAVPFLLYLIFWIKKWLSK